MKLYRTTQGILVEAEGSFHTLPNRGWSELLADPDLFSIARQAAETAPVQMGAASIIAPIVEQEVWAAGVTYFRSRDARIAESKEAGGSSFYDRVYAAERPELFYKGAGWRVIGPGGAVRIRSDASWSVPEPELALVINPSGKIVGYTIGNDMSSRDIEGENPLYLPQAKVYDGSCALGPAILLADEPLSKSISIEIEIQRKSAVIFQGNTTLAELKREPTQLVEYLFRDQGFPHGVFLMTGTGIVPGDDFTLLSGDVIRISIAGIGILENHVA
ncbi:2-dehydro-3-deoxy-D-arabinonate dehydratase [Granulicella aggregans]|uniref:2-dehydro-3-deoxy-D-arabinonate dehydratase n=1 Tax=Granulicella aggregans TaxID=474949 RepID=A0A7W7ZAD3_9BACT|nr:fumarylacetoacetate hydrolase family protein [Granulicella aggregans]MBB5056245.1 2-dehydro-3-deoxy-D-arabinonate dehydratase [Granulicella aggregans]